MKRSEFDALRGKIARNLRQEMVTLGTTQKEVETLVEGAKLGMSALYLELKILRVLQLEED